MFNQEFINSGIFYPINGVTTYNFVVIGAGGGGGGGVELEKMQLMVVMEQ